jgi:hypothetical protein
MVKKYDLPSVEAKVLRMQNEAAVADEPTCQTLDPIGCNSFPGDHAQSMAATCRESVGGTSDRREPLSGVASVASPSHEEERGK